MKLKTLIIVTFITIFVNQTLLSNELEFSGSFSTEGGDVFLDSSLAVRYDKDHKLYLGISSPVYYQDNDSFEHVNSPVDGMRVSVGMSSRYLFLGKLRSQGEFALLRYISHKGDITTSLAADPVTLGKPISVLLRIPGRSVIGWDITQKGQLFSLSAIHHVSAVTLGMFLYRFSSWDYAHTQYAQSGGHGLIAYQKGSHIFYVRGGVSVSTLDAQYGYILRGDYRFKKSPWDISCFVQGNNRSFSLPHGNSINSNIHTELSVTHTRFSLLGEFVYRPSYIFSSGYKKFYASAGVSLPLIKQHMITMGYQFLYVRKGSWHTTNSHAGEISYTIDWERWKILSSFELVHYPLELRNTYEVKIEYQLDSDPWKIRCRVQYDFSESRMLFYGKISYEQGRKTVSLVVEENKKVSLVFLWKL